MRTQSSLRVAAAPDRVRRARRALPLALAAILPLFLIAFTTLVMLPTMNRFFNPEASQMLALLEMLYQPNPAPGSRLANPDVRRAIETYIAGRHGTRLRDPGFWNSPVMRNVSDRLRKTAEGVAARHPSVSADELRQATATIAPELQRRRQRPREDVGDIAGIMIMFAGTFALLPALLLGILSSLIVRGGLFTRMLGHAVVTRDGTEIGRMRSLARVLVAWSPALVWLIYLAMSPKVQGFVPTPPNPLAGTLLTLGALGVGAILTIARPNRGPHDWLLGTWVVPR